MLSIAMLSASACKTHIEPEVGSIHDLEIKLETVDAHIPSQKTVFQQGERIQFSLTETNTNRKVSVKYAHENVPGQHPILGCQVLDANGNRVNGVVRSDELFPFSYRINELGTGKTKYHSVTWDRPQIGELGDTFVNPALNIGDYFLSVSYTLVGWNGPQFVKQADRNKRIITRQFPFSVK